MINLFRCIGENFADALVYLTLASVIATFNISRPVINGEEMVPEVSYPHFVGHPGPFESRITLRDSVAKALIDNAVELETED